MLFSLFRVLSALCLCLLLSSVSAFAADEWLPIDPNHLAMKEAKVEKDADAEALFWEVRIDDSSYDLIFNHYIRVKIFNERGVESNSKVDITYADWNRIRDVAARTIKPDGTIVELKKEAVFERTLIKLSGLKLKAKSFALPSIEPGSIIEYRWKEVRPGSYVANLQLEFQRNIPVQMVRYYLKPSSSPLLGGMKTFTFNGANPTFNKEKNGFYSTTMLNVPAFKEEPRMPPEDKVRTWMLVYYSQEDKVDPQAYWTGVGKRLYGEFKPKTKPNDDVKRKTAELIAGAATSEEKLDRLITFCRTQIKNIYSDTTEMSAEERKKLKDNNNPGDTLKRGYGDSNDIDCLFTAMATAAEFEARLALMPDRSRFFFDPSFPSTYFLRGGEIAVRVDGQWKFYDPSGKYITNGMLPWFYEGVKALITDPKEPVWVTTPVSAAEKSQEKRTAKLKLREDGTLEGDVRMEYTGHLAVQRKRDNDEDTTEQREETLRNLIRSRLGGAEITSIKIENVTDQTKPFVYDFHIVVPGYAQRTGKRLLLQPSFFQQGKGALFSASERKYPIYFHYPWSEQDEVLIELPEGFSLDNAEAPQAITAGDTSSVKFEIGVTRDQKFIYFKRDFHFGGSKGTILFPVDTYANLKRLFDAYHQADGHTLSLKQQSPAAASKGN
jgi:hypothetical protein